MTDTRHAELEGELEARGWLGGEFHQRHGRDGLRALIFGRAGEVQIGVMAVPDRPACTLLPRVRQVDPATGKSLVVQLRIERPAIAGEGYQVRLDTPVRHLKEDVQTPQQAVALMEEWRDSLPDGWRAIFTAAHRPPPSPKKPRRHLH